MSNYLGRRRSVQVKMLENKLTQYFKSNNFPASNQQIFGIISSNIKETWVKEVGKKYF